MADPGQDSSPGWDALAGLYRASFGACGVEVRHVTRPEIYHSGRARQVIGLEPGDWHLAVRPLDRVRPFHGLPNAYVCDWPFPELSDAPLGGSPFLDQLRLLRQADAVLCCTPHTTGTLRAAGIAGALTMPPVIPAPAGGAPGHRQGRAVLCAVAADRVDQQLGHALDGFDLVRRLDGDVRLTVWLEGGDAGQAAGLWAQSGNSPAVTVLAGSDPANLSRLLAEADFFLCPHAAPGLHVPLAQAMLAGVPPVATLVAGTASVLLDGAAVPIRTEDGVPDRSAEPAGAFLTLTAHPPSAGAIRDALLAALALGPPDRERLGRAAQAAAREQFGSATFADRLSTLRRRLVERPA